VIALERELMGLRPPTRRGPAPAKRPDPWAEWPNPADECDDESRAFGPLRDDEGEPDDLDDYDARPAGAVIADLHAMLDASAPPATAPAASLAPGETPQTEAAAPPVPPAPPQRAAHAGHPPAWIFNAADFLAKIAGAPAAPVIKGGRGPPKGSVRK
jgi:hypothetical protein